MGYKSAMIEPFLPHTNSTYINYEFVSKFLWYLTSKESYIQRTTFFDNGILDKSSPIYSPAYDYFFLIYLFYGLGLDELRYYTVMKDLDNDVDILTAADLTRNLLFFHDGNKSAFYSFNDKMRNSIAHGTFNNNGSRNIMIGQNKAKLSSTYNFFLQLNNYSSERENEIFELDLGILNDLNSFCIKCLVNIPNIRVNNNTLYFNDMKIVFDDKFVFERKTGVSEEEQLNRRFSNCKNELIILLRDSSNLSVSKLRGFNGFNVVPYNKLFDYFGINIKRVYNSQNN